MSEPFRELDPSDRVALITGANAGIGKETARALAGMGAQVILGCRDKNRGQRAADDITTTTGNRSVSVLTVDLASLPSVREAAAAFGERLSALDILVHLLTPLLLPTLAASPSARVVTVSTSAAGGLRLSDTQFERRRFSGTGAYRASKTSSAQVNRDPSLLRPINVLQVKSTANSSTISARPPRRKLPRLDAAECGPRRGPPQHRRRSACQCPTCSGADAHHPR